MDDYYLIIGVESFCNDKVLLRMRYRKQIAYFHPDSHNVSEEIAMEKTKLLNICYETLTDDAKKADYDNQLRQYYASQKKTTAEESGSNKSRRREEEERKSKTQTNHHNMNNAYPKRETSGGISYELIRNVGTIPSGGRSWSKEVNIIKWSGGSPKYDIRDWAPDHSKMSKGVTLTEQEARNLYILLKRIF